MRQCDRRWLVAVIAVGVALRFWNLGGKSLWLDETFSVWLASQTPEAIWSMAGDPHPRLYYVVLREALKLGSGEIAARVPSAMISVVSLAILFVLARRLAGPTVAWLAAALLAVSPLDLWYAQEARMYAFVAAAGLLAALGLVINPWLGALLVAAGLTAGMYFDYLMLPLWVAITAAWVALPRGPSGLARRWPAWMCGTAIAAVATLPLWAEGDAALRGLVTGSYLAQDVERIFGTTLLRDWGYPVVLAMASLCVILTLGAIRLLAGSERTRGGVIVVTWLAFVVATATMPIPRMYTVKKVLVLGWPFVVIGAAWALAALPAWWRKMATVTALSVSMAGAVINVALVQKDDWRGVARYVSQHVPVGDAIWLDPAWGEIAYRHYAPTSTPASSVPGTTLADLLQNRRPVWLIVYARFGVAGPDTPSRTWLDREARLTGRVAFSGLDLLRYEARTTR